MGFEPPVLLDGGISRLVLPPVLIEEAYRSGWFETTDFKRDRADGPTEIFMPGPANIHRDFNRKHYLFQCDLWFPLHDVNEKEVIRLYPHLYREPVFDMDATEKNLAELGHPLEFSLKFGDAVIFHGEHIHTSPKCDRPDYRRHTYDFRIAAACQDDNKHYRYNFLNINNFLSNNSQHPGLNVDYTRRVNFLHYYAKHNPCAIFFLLAVEHQKDMSPDDYGIIFEIFDSYPFAEDRYLILADIIRERAPAIAIAAACRVTKESKYYFWMLRAGEILVSLGKHSEARSAYEKARSYAIVTQCLPNYMPVVYANSELQLMPEVAVRVAEQRLANL